MLTDNLLRQEALDPLCASVPAGHVPVGVEHVDRVVDDRLHEQLVRFFQNWLIQLFQHPPTAAQLLTQTQRIEPGVSAEPARAFAVAAELKPFEGNGKFSCPWTEVSRP